jgi:eukaryotic-like serine/threonine-protein kinase
MDAQRWQRIEVLFEAAIEKPEDQRRAWLAQTCADDPTLIDDVEAMLGADTTHDELAARVGRSVEHELQAFRLEPGQRVGAWTVEDLLASGGMGSVYRARRSDRAYEQSVVIKVVALPLNDQLHESFRRERQFLADLSHPYIARLLDGGTLPGGEPYLVMEYVRGCDIATWCDQQLLGLVDRLALFNRVCEAIQFAHASLVVHRDIKPANVLVDESGTPRLLDFGIASLLESDDHEGNRPQAAADNRLTSAYASPEQRRGQPVTTASDVYSLGALLYRLLTGEPPRFDEPDSVRPMSTSMSGMVRADTGRILEADLDAVVSKALADDPDQRYATPQALVEDLERVQGLRPTRARPVGQLGRLSRAVHRNRLLSATIAGSALLVLAFIISISVLAFHLDRERDHALVAAATTEQVSDFVFELFDGADPEVSQGETPTARELLDRGTARIREELDGQVRIRARLLHRMGRAYQGLGQYEQANDLMVDALDSVDPDDAALRWTLMVDLADVERLLGLRTTARERLDTVIENLAENGEFSRQLASAYNNRGLIAAEQEQFEYAEELAHRALAVKLPAGTEREVLHTRYRHNLALTLGRQGRHDEAIEVLESVIADKREVLGELNPSTLRSIEVLAGNHRQLGDFDTAAARFEEALEHTVAIYGEASAAEARINNSLGNVHHDRGDYARAEQTYRRALAFHDDRPEADPLTHVFLVNNLASLFEDRGNLNDAEVLFRRSLAMRRELAGEDELLVIHARANLARVLIQQDRLDEAESLLAQVDEALATHFPDNRFRRLQLDWQAALLEAARGNLEHGRDEMRAVLEQLEGEWPDLAARHASARLNAVEIDLQLGAYTEAERRAGEALELLQSIRSVDHPDRLRAEVLRAEALAAQGDRTGAAAVVRPLWPTLANRFSPDSRILATANQLISK